MIECLLEVRSQASYGLFVLLQSQIGLKIPHRYPLVYLPIHLSRFRQCSDGLQTSSDLVAVVTDIKSPVQVAQPQIQQPLLDCPLSVQLLEASSTGSKALAFYSLTCSYLLHLLVLAPWCHLLPLHLVEIESALHSPNCTGAEPQTSCVLNASGQLPSTRPTNKWRFIAFRGISQVCHILNIYTTCWSFGTFCVSLGVPADTKLCFHVALL